MFHIKLEVTYPIEFEIPYTKKFIGQQNIANVKAYTNG